MGLVKWIERGQPVVVTDRFILYVRVLWFTAGFFPTLVWLAFR